MGGVDKTEVDKTTGEAKRKRLLYTNYNAGMHEIQSGSDIGQRLSHPSENLP